MCSPGRQEQNRCEHGSRGSGRTPKSLNAPGGWSVEPHMLELPPCPQSSWILGPRRGRQALPWDRGKTGFRNLVPEAR